MNLQTVFIFFIFLFLFFIFFLIFYFYFYFFFFICIFIFFYSFLIYFFFIFFIFLKKKEIGEEIEVFCCSYQFISFVTKSGKAGIISTPESNSFGVKNWRNHKHIYLMETPEKNKIVDTVGGILKSNFLIFFFIFFFIFFLYFFNLFFFCYFFFNFELNRRVLYSLFE